ncbi:N-acetylmuramoyl-L-alanine amidase [Georgenia sp. H159]|uniref:N-acetylmuramoyl-L-alanine amidase n=1 Tax=Georgenia sp. H159 TaxID=3076115 RepID=UPI002D77E2E3|nr:N-acetylmuramoyl-L-alanine amidase [Georgenia sp. H159]
MALHTHLGSLVLATSLAAGGALPVAAAGTVTGEEQPVSVIALTTEDGSLTPLADEGLTDLQDVAAQQSAPDAALSAPDTAQIAPSSAQPESDAAATAAPEQSAAPEPATGAAPEGVAVLTAPLATEEFYVAGVTWDGAQAMPQDAAVFIRVMEGGQWQQWAELEVENSADEPGSTGGTEPYVAAGAEAVQVQITGDAARLPAGVRLNLTPEWPSAEEVVLEEEAPVAPVLPTAEPLAPEPAGALPFQQQTAAAPAAAPTVTQPAGTTTAVASASTQSSGVMATGIAPRPSITSRAGWGADEAKMNWRPYHVDLRAAVVHHTAGSNNYTQSQTPGVVRGIYHYHAVTRGWGDIGYNFLVDKWGRIYEGRSGSLAAASGKMPVGAHAAPFNTGTMGLSVMGDYTKVGVPQAAMDAMADIIAWQFGRAGLDATHLSGLTAKGVGVRPAGQSLGRVFAHKDVSSTACPGNDIYGRIGWLARAANERVGSGVTTPAPSPAPAPSAPDVRPTDPFAHTATVYLNNDWGPWHSIDFILGNAGTEVYTGDWDGDGKDTLALRVGSTFHVFNSNTTGARAWVASYGRPDDEVLVGDWDGDGRDSFAVRRGTTFYTKNSITNGVADDVFAYGRDGDEVLVGDWNNDRRSTFAVRRGSTFYVKNSLAGGRADHEMAYGRADDTVLVGDWDGNRSDTFGVRRGSTYYIKNRIAGGNADIVQTYGRPGDTVLVGDWDGNRTDTLGVHRP